VGIKSRAKSKQLKRLFLVVSLFLTVQIPIAGASDLLPEQITEIICEGRPTQEMCFSKTYLKVKTIQEMDVVLNRMELQVLTLGFGMGIDYRNELPIRPKTYDWESLRGQGELGMDSVVQKYVGYKDTFQSVLAKLQLDVNKIPETIKKYKNCTAMNKDYPGGVARAGAQNLGGKIKRSPLVNTDIYLKNKTLDRDKDGLVCEK
jgi:hypothetical protein